MAQTSTTSTTSISLAGIAELKSSEGLRLCPYLDSVKVPTIGIGSTFYEDGRKVTMQDACITEQRAEQLALHTLNSIFLPGILRELKVPVNQHQLDALASLVYNIGVGAFSTSTLLKRINSGADRASISAAFLMWNKGGGKVLKGLVARREREIALYYS